MAAVPQIITQHLSNLHRTSAHHLVPSISHRFWQLYSLRFFVMCSIIDDLLLLLIVVEQDNTNLQHAFVHSWYQKWFLQKLSKTECRRQLDQIPRSALLSPPKSMWKRVLQSRNNQALITLTGINFVKLDMVVYPFQYSLTITHLSLLTELLSHWRWKMLIDQDWYPLQMVWV